MPEQEDTTRYYVRAWRKGVENYWTWRDMTEDEALALMKQIENRGIRVEPGTGDTVMQVTDLSDIWTAKMIKES